MDWLGEYARRLDLVPVAEEGRIEGAVLCPLIAMGVLDGASTDEPGPIRRETGEQERHALVDTGSASDFLCCDGSMASARVICGDAEREAGLVGGSQCAYWSCRIQYLLSLVHLAADSAEWRHGGMVRLPSADAGKRNRKEGREETVTVTWQGNKSDATKRSEEWQRTEKVLSDCIAWRISSKIPVSIQHKRFLHHLVSYTSFRSIIRVESHVSILPCRCRKDVPSNATPF